MDDQLQLVDPESPGLTRRRHGRGFMVLDENGERVADKQTAARVRELAIPPAWSNVWICHDPRGHIQATGVDAAGRRQYLYHPLWRVQRDREKFDRMLSFAERLPLLRQRVAAELPLEGMPWERALACAGRLLDRCFFRIGNEQYEEENDSYGLATLKRRHVTLGSDGATITFDYRAKGGKRRVQRLVDGAAFDALTVLKRRRGPGDLLAYKAGRAWVDVRSDDINQYVKSTLGAEYTAKDFRTWHATVLAALSIALLGRELTGERMQQRVTNLACSEVARYLGNTPAVCRASYIDPRVFEQYRRGVTIESAAEDFTELGELDGASLQLRLERSTRELILSA